MYCIRIGKLSPIEPFQKLNISYYYIYYTQRSVEYKCWSYPMCGRGLVDYPFPGPIHLQRASGISSQCPSSTSWFSSLLASLPTHISRSTFVATYPVHRRLFSHNDGAGSQKFQTPRRVGEGWEGSRGRLVATIFFSLTGESKISNRVCC